MNTPSTARVTQGVHPEIDRDPASLIVEDRDKLEARAERFEVLAQRRHADVFGVCSSLEIAPWVDVEAGDGRRRMVSGAGPNLAGHHRIWSRTCWRSQYRRSCARSPASSRAMITTGTRTGRLVASTPRKGPMWWPLQVVSATTMG